ncbi:MAG: TadE/TadG family type IV pilus assembly protein [Planctomycetota bacterium]|nr:TadE/TadG family type IV pilus assembly protein [Planctomycetota bacterium]
MNKLNSTKKKRQGIATTELAVCLPILILLTLGILETCTVIFLKESITIAAYEGARVGIRKQGTNAMVAQTIKEFLDARQISYESDFLRISDPGFDHADELEHVTVRLKVPCQGNTYTGWIFSSRAVSASVTMRKEFSNLLDSDGN